MRLSNLIYTIIVCFLISIIFAQIHQIGYIAGAALQDKEVKIQTSFSAPENFQNWDKLTEKEQTVVYFSGFLLPALFWFLFFLILPKTSNSIVIVAEVWSSLIFFLYQLINIVSISTLLLSIKPFGRAAKATLNSGTKPLTALFVTLSIFIMSILLLVYKKYKFENLKRIFVSRIEFYREFNILGSFLVAILAFSLILTAVRVRPLTFFKFDLLGSYTLQTEYIVTKDLMEENLYNFVLKEEKKVVIDIQLNNINSQYFEMWLSDGQSNTLLIQDDDIEVLCREIQVEMFLDAGVYQIMLTNFNKEINNSTVTLKVNIY
ncbi:MAG: hypothetical protein JXR56_02430 [Candidatus Cloacimonetes bacterium]|nr:hypothetical protein [Candidatus Cloacimonadota bacterium]